MILRSNCLTTLCPCVFDQNEQAVNGDELFSLVDHNQDGSVAFAEFSMMIATVAIGAHEVLEEVRASSGNK